MFYRNIGIYQYFKIFLIKPTLDSKINTNQCLIFSCKKIGLNLYFYIFFVSKENNSKINNRSNTKKILFKIII